MRGLDGLGFAPGPALTQPEVDFADFSWAYSVPPITIWNGGGGASQPGTVYPPGVDVCFDDWTCEVVPILQQIVTKTCRPCFAEWYGEVKGLDQNHQPISLGSDGHNTQRAEEMLKQKAVGGVIYAMWLETVRRFNPDGTTVTVGRYDRNTGMVTVSDTCQGGGTYFPTIPSYPTTPTYPSYPTYPPTQGGGMFGGLDQNTLLMLLAGGAIVIWAATRKK